MGFQESTLFCRELAYVIENSQAGTVLTTQEFASRVAPLARKAQARCLILDEVAATSDTFSSGSATLQQPLPDTGKHSIATLSSLTCLARPIRQAVLIECAQPSAPDAAGNAHKLPNPEPCSAMQVIAFDHLTNICVLCLPWHVTSCRHRRRASLPA